MANFDDVATNADIAPIADAIRRVTRTVTPMTIPEMPERLLDIRVVETQVVAVNLPGAGMAFELQLIPLDPQYKHFVEALLLSYSNAAKDTDLTVDIHDDAVWVAGVSPGNGLEAYFQVTDYLLASDDTDRARLLVSYEQCRLEVPVTRGAGVGSVTNKTVDDGISRANTISGKFSAGFGSRIVITRSESFGAGGIIEITGEDAFGAGYRITVAANQAGSGGYRCTNRASESFQWGDNLLIDGTITFDDEGSPSSDSRHNAQFGMYCTMGVGTQACFQAGERITQGAVCKWNAEFGFGHTIGAHCECVTVIDYSNTVEAYITDSLIAGYDNTARNSNGSSSNKKYDIYMFGHENTNRDANGTDHSNVYFLGKGLRPVKDDQVIAGAYNAGVANSWFEVGCGTSTGNRKSAFAVCQQGNSYWIMLGTTKLSKPANDGTIATQEYVTGIVGDINSVLDAINGEVI